VLFAFKCRAVEPDCPQHSPSQQHRYRISHAHRSACISRQVEQRPQRGRMPTFKQEHSLGEHDNSWRAAFWCDLCYGIAFARVQHCCSAARSAAPCERWRAGDALSLAPAARRCDVVYGGGGNPTATVALYIRSNTAEPMVLQRRLACKQPLLALPTAHPYPHPTPNKTEKRAAEAGRIREKYPDRVPVSGCFCRFLLALSQVDEAGRADVCPTPVAALSLTPTHPKPTGDR